MKRNTLIAIGLLAAAAGPAAFAQDNNPGAAPDWSAFQSIAQKNIFDSSRGPGRTRIGERPRPRIIRVFTFRGTMDDRAIFTGEGAPGVGCVKEGDLINGFTVRQITMDTVKLAEPNGNLVVLQPDDTMRREEDGPWLKSDQPMPETVATPGTPSGDTAVSAAPGPTGGPVGESEILKRLRLKREQENK